MDEGEGVDAIPLLPLTVLMMMPFNRVHANTEMNIILTESLRYFA